MRLKEGKQRGQKATIHEQLRQRTKIERTQAALTEKINSLLFWFAGNNL